MGINLGAGFENLNGNSSISNQSAGILNLNKKNKQIQCKQYINCKKRNKLS